ncbi:hypothetical protein F2Q69_00046519 [Brassica cretica]|uniref:Uncharacterized protein n=1 Tax=Brassica cretica TaxID=69181 RepID=A0A8S9PSH4_BRACR|nr:hypothetical protein F2Q69_00046519 [Brassica cretica]
MGMAKPKVDLSTLSLEGDKVDLDSSGPDGAYRQLEGPPVTFSLSLLPLHLSRSPLICGGCCRLLGFGLRFIFSLISRHIFSVREEERCCILSGSSTVRCFLVQAVIRLGRESLVGTSSLSVIKLSMVDAGGFLFHRGELLLELCGRLA